MLNKDDFKVVGLYTKEILESLGPVVTIGLLAYKSFRSKPKATYSDAVNAIMSSGMYSEDKSKAVAALQIDQKPELYEAVIRIAKSSMFSDVKAKTIISIGDES